MNEEIRAQRPGGRPAVASPPADPAAPVPGRRRWLVLAVVGVAQLMVVLDATIVNIALPSAQRALGFGIADRQRVITACPGAGACTSTSRSQPPPWRGPPP
jgi:hypothetical protein